MRIAREGMPFVVFGFVVLAVLLGLAWQAHPLWWIGGVAWLPIAVWIPWFFRNPERITPQEAQAVISPADGKIVAIETVDEPDFLAGRALKISVFMNVFNVHVNRYPTEGRVEYRVYRPGKFFNATLDKASIHNEQMSIGLLTNRGRILVRQIAGLVARRIVTDHFPGEQVSRGARLGLIRFGSRVDTFLPEHANVQVQLGQTVVAGETIIAQWPE